MDDNTKQCAILLKDTEVQAQFAEYYYDYTTPIQHSDVYKETPKESTEGENKKDIINKKDISDVTSPGNVNINVM